MKSLRITFLIVAFSLLNFSSLQAAITTYTDLSAYQAALSGANEEIEDFNSATVGNFTNPINETGFNFFSVTGNTDDDNVGIFAGTGDDDIDGTQYLGWDGSDVGPTFNFIFDDNITAFAFQWTDNDGSDVYRLVVTEDGTTSQYYNPPFSNSTGTGFCGIISDDSFTQVTIENQSYGGVISGFGLDNFRMATADVTPASIPTMNEWGIIIMSVILAGSAFWMMRRRQI